MVHFPGMRFAGCPINRAAAHAVRKDPDAIEALRKAQEARFVLVCAKRVSVASVQAMTLRMYSTQEVAAQDREAFAEAIYLGPLAGKSTTEAPLQIFVAKLQGTEPPASGGMAWLSGRELLGAVPAEDAAIAGLALALTSWHETAKFDGRSGASTVAVEGGMKRQVQGSSGKLYPRLDPVAIGLITSPDGKRCLLTRARSYPPGMYTCLSGFIDQCEGVEEAFIREAKEEADVELKEVDFVGSQPWPIGRAGSCELMIGCRATATSDSIKVNEDEIEDARWFSKAEVRQMLERSTGAQKRNEGDLWTPPPFAIAHHLIAGFITPPQVTRRRDGATLLAFGFAVSFGFVAGVIASQLMAAARTSRL